MKLNKIITAALLVATAAGSALATQWSGTAYVGSKSTYVYNSALAHVTYATYASIGGAMINSINITNVSCGSGSGTATKVVTDYPGLVQSIQQLDQAMVYGLKLTYMESQTLASSPTYFCAFPTSGWFSLRTSK